MHHIRQDVAILCLKYNTNSDKACFGPAPGEKDNHKKDPVSPGHAPFDFDTRTKYLHFAFTGTIVTGKFCHSFPSYRCLSEIDQSPFKWTSNGDGALWLTTCQVIGLLWFD